MAGRRGISLFTNRHSDWLGSSRFASTSTRTMYNDLAYAPFGEQYAQAGSTGVTDTSFAGNDENTVVNLYDAQFREYGIQGRWPSPDPAGFAAADPSNPQSWNRYAYVMNNPLALSDPQGTDPCTATLSPKDCPNGGGIASGCIGAEPGSSTFQQCGGWLGYAGMSPWAWFRPFDPFDLLGYFYVGENGDVGWGNHLPAFLGDFGDNSNLWPSNLSGMPQMPQTTQQKYQRCIANFKSSTTGKTISFGSLLDIRSNPVEWFGLGGAKAVGIHALDTAEQSAAVTDYSITAGITTEPAALVGSKLLGTVGFFAIGTATYADLQARNACSLTSQGVSPSKLGLLQVTPF